MNKTALLALLLCFYLPAVADSGDTTIPKKKYTTQRLDGTINLDGIPDEAAWNNVEWGGDFIQYQPHEGRDPSQQTNFKILYDDKFLYIGYMCHDNAPDSIVKRMSRRDQF